MRKNNAEMLMKKPEAFPLPVFVFQIVIQL